MGIAYATFAAALGIPVTLALPTNASRKRVTILNALGTELVLTDPLEGSDGAIRVVHQMAAQHPDLSAQIFDGDDQLRPFVNLFLNNENIKDLQDVQTPLKENDRLLIIPSIAGGNQYQISNLERPCYLSYPTKKFYATRATC
jgi:molybdopterin converting factor small subunit